MKPVGAVITIWRGFILGLDLEMAMALRTLSMLPVSL